MVVANNLHHGLHGIIHLHRWFTIQGAIAGLKAFRSTGPFQVSIGSSLEKLT